MHKLGHDRNENRPMGFRPFLLASSVEAVFSSLDASLAFFHAAKACLRYFASMIISVSLHWKKSN